MVTFEYPKINSLLLKILLFFIATLMLVRYIFPLVLRFALLKWAERIKTQHTSEQSQTTNEKKKKGTADLGEYIDYEEVE